jgi:hypothetical protein
VAFLVSGLNSSMITKASPIGMLRVMAKSSAVMLGFSRNSVSLVYALCVGYITFAWAVSTSMSQSFSFVYASKFISNQHRLVCNRSYSG